MKIDFSQLKYVFIDFDGTLVDSVPVLYQHYMNFLHKLGRQGSRAEFEVLMGPTIKEFVPILAKRHGLDKDEEHLCELYFEGLQDTYCQVQLMDKAREFLELLDGLGLKALLVTSSPRFFIDESLDFLKIKNHFLHLVTGEMVRNTKPSPEIYELALTRCGARADEVVAIEDSFQGVTASLGARIPTILLQEELHPGMPAKLIHAKSWKEIIELFRNGYAK